VAGSATGEGFKARGDEYRGRAGALTLFRIATRGERQPALPEEDEAFVAEQLERWLDGCPDGPLEPGAEAEPALAALLDGWCSTLVHTFAAGPLTVHDALAAIDGLEDPACGEQLAAMEIAGLLSPCEDEDGEDGDGEMRLAATDWLRRAIGPLAAAARLEFQLPQGETEPIAPLDVEAAFLLALPLIELPEELQGTCRLTVPVSGRPPELAGVVVLVEDGEIASISTDLTIDSNNFASAPPGAWIDTLIDPEVASVDYGGDPQFAFSMLHGLHEVLFAVAVG